ncbi:MAG: DUF3488 and transglutaminase-like domain-containing protein [Microthrixaceae bacterium]
MKVAPRLTPGRRTKGDRPAKEPARTFDTGDGSNFLAEVGLLVLALGTVAGFIRLFDSWAFFVPLAVVTVLSWTTALLLRRAGTHIALATLVHTIIGIVVLGVTFVPESTVMGVPLPRTLSTAWLEITNSFIEIRSLIPPVEATTGFLIAVAAGIWTLVLYADTAAMRVDAVVQAAAPFALVFLAAGIPAQESGRTTAIVFFLASLVIYAITTQFDRFADLRWADRSPSRGASSVARSAAAIAVVGGIFALVAGVALPDQSRRIDLRKIGQGPGERTVVSPFVGVTSLLGPRSNSEMFRIRSDNPSYWRLTALGSFDEKRNIWVSHGTYSPIRGRIERSTARSLPVTRLRQDYQLLNLSGPWLPAAFEPGQIAGDVTATYDPASSSLINDDEDSREFTYTVDSYIPDFSTIQERGSVGGGDNSALDPELLEVPEISLRLRRTFDGVTGQTRDPYQKMVLLQDWFRSTFTYDESVDYSKAADPLEQFIAQRRGFCQQFSSTFALLARYAGLPSRVAVGFTQGDLVTSDSSGPEGSSEFEYSVRGRHAHAWPEVYFADFGWVPFEPTPGRGNPAATTYTGIQGAQAPLPAPGNETTEPSTSVPSPTSTPPAAPPTTVAADDSGPDSRQTPVGGLVSQRGVAVFAVAVLLLCGAALHRYRKRPRGGSTDICGPAQRVRNSWEDCLRALTLAGIDNQPTDTPLEFAGRAEVRLMEMAEAHPELVYVDPESGVSATPDSDLRLLADAETFRRYGPEADSEVDSELTHERTNAESRDTDQVELAARRIISWTRRLSNRLERLERLIRS